MEKNFTSQIFWVSKVNQNLPGVIIWHWEQQVFAFSGYDLKAQHTDLNVICLLTGKWPIQKTQHTPGGEEPCVNEAMETYGEDPALNELIQKLVRTYYRGDAEKKAHLVGFLIGADPGE